MNGVFSGSVTVRGIAFEEEPQAITVPIVLNRIADIYVERNTVEPDIVLNDSIVNQAIEKNVEISWEDLKG